MAKQRISNYVFLPGVANTANAYPNAYSLISANKTFIQREAAAYIASRVAYDTAQNLVPNAVAILTANKAFLQAEINAWIAAQIAANNPPFTGYVFDAATQSKCSRDVGYVIDAYIQDLRYGGNEQTLYVASQYWISGTSQVLNTAVDAAGQVRLRDIIYNNILPQITFTPVNVSLTQVTGLAIAEAGATASINTLGSIISSAIPGGLSTLPAVSYSNYNFAVYVYDSAKCIRDMGYIIDAYLWDLRYGGNIKTRFNASRYFDFNGLPQIHGDRKPEVVTHTFIETLINTYILPQAAYTSPYQGDYPIERDPLITYEPGSTARITALRTLLTDVITNGLASLPAKSNGVGQIKFAGRYTSETILLITNTLTNTIYYNFSDTATIASVTFESTYNSNGNSKDDDFPTFLQTADYVTTITLGVDSSTQSSSDPLQIFVEAKEMRIRPYDFGTDAIERQRVGIPQSMLDADFEYGLQPTKWQAIGVARGYPSVYEVPGTDTPVLTVTTDASTGSSGVGESLMTVTTNGPHGFVIGTPITIKGLLNTVNGFDRAEGTFLVVGVPTTTTFTYYASSKVGTSNGQVLAQTYTQLRKGDFYTGAAIGSPTFQVYSNGANTIISSKFITASSTDQIAFTGTAPTSGSPITGSGLPSGVQISAVVGTGGSSAQASPLIETNAAIGATSIVLASATGVLQGMAIDNGTGTSVFVSSVVGSTVNLTGPLTATKRGSTTTYLDVEGTNITPAGINAVFSVVRTSGVYASVTATTTGASYAVGDRILLAGTALGGVSPTNDVTITVATVNGLGAITSLTYTGTSVSGDRTYTELPASGGDGNGATFDVTRSAGVYTVVTKNSSGIGYAAGNTLTIAGDVLGGASPANDLTITVSTIDVGGPIATFTKSGTAVSGDRTFTNQAGTNVAPLGTGGSFDITRSAGAYTVITANRPGTGYVTGDRITIPGTLLGGATTANDLTLSITASAGSLTGGSGIGTAILGQNLDFWSSIALNDLTTASIPNATTLTNLAIATLQVNFNTNHGLVPGAALLISISSSGTNHQLAAGPFFVEQVPSTTSIRYTARTTGTIDTGTAMTGIMYTRPNTFFIHRPFDGGVQLGTGGPQHGVQAIRMSKKYIRYQSGKGFMYTTGALFAPNFNILSLTSTGLAVGSYITLVTDDIDHGCQSGGSIRIAGVDTFGYNGTYTIADIVDERTFRVQATTTLGNVYATISSSALVSILNWHGATVRAGTYDDQNGVYWQYDGINLAVGRRSSTLQLAGVASIAKDNNLVTGTNTRFRDQLKAGDRIIIRGMTHVVSHVNSQTSLTVTPDYRGAINASNAKMCLVQDLIIKQRDFNVDRLDGTGPSGYNLDITKMQMIGLQWSWYGAGFIDYMLRGSDGNFVFAHRIRNSNVNTEAFMRTGNQPVRYEVINEGARGKLLNSVTSSQNTLPLYDASDFPSGGTVYVDNELISFSGKSGNTLIGCTRAVPLLYFAAGAQRTFTAGAATTHEYNTGVILISNTISPIISHWGSAIITDGQFDSDRGYIFNYASTGISVSTTKQTAFLIRLAPSVSNAIVGDLGERELLNRAQLLLQGITLTADSDTSGGGIVVEGVLNPQNYPTDPANISWFGLAGTAGGGQPSFSQIAPGGSVNWSTGATQTTANATTSNQMSASISEIYSVGGNAGYLYIDATSWNNAGAVVGAGISGSNIQANTTITGATNYSSYYFITISKNTTGNVNGGATLTITLGGTLTNTNYLFFTKVSWESLGATVGTEVQDTKFPAGTRVQTIGALATFGGTQYYRINFTQSSKQAITAASTVAFVFGQPPFALPGETVFSFIAATGGQSTLELSQLKELTNTTLGGRGTYPNGPDVLAINVYKTAGTATVSNIVLRWGEAQA